MSADIDNIMRLANLMAMKKVRRFACNQQHYRGNETDKVLSVQVDKAAAELRAAVEAALEEAGNPVADANWPT
jgi:hypothetical protein